MISLFSGAVHRVSAYVRTGYTFPLRILLYVASRMRDYLKLRRTRRISVDYTLNDEILMGRSTASREDNDYGARRRYSGVLPFLSPCCFTDNDEGAFVGQVKKRMVRRTPAFINGRTVSRGRGREWSCPTQRRRLRIALIPSGVLCWILAIEFVAMGHPL